MTDFIDTLPVYKPVSDEEKRAAEHYFQETIRPSKAATESQKRRAKLIRTAFTVVIVGTISLGSAKFAMSETGINFFIKANQSIASVINPSNSFNVSQLPASMPDQLKAAVVGETDMEYEEFHTLFQNYVSSLINGDEEQIKDYYQLASAVGAATDPKERISANTETALDGGVHEMILVTENARDLAVNPDVTDQTRLVAGEFYATSIVDANIVGENVNTYQGPFSNGTLVYAEQVHLTSDTELNGISEQNQALFNKLNQKEMKTR